jgi:8-oxo-dGTP diphosphatase
MICALLFYIVGNCFIMRFMNWILWGHIMTELWDAYDSAFNRIKDMTLVRGEALPDGVYHLVCDVVVKHMDGSYLLMQRDFRKRHGGMWELTAGGSALQGEGALECAKRELKEETGLNAGNLEEIGRIVHDGRRSLYVEYLCVLDCCKDSIVLQEGETVDYKWVDREVLFRMDSREFASARIRKLLEELDL